MKQLFLLLTIITLSCKAQTPVLPVYESGAYDLNNAYYKDIANFQNQFVGTWILNDGTNYLKVTFIKKPMFLRTTPKRSNYVDYLIGEYEYKRNGTLMVNTLSNINVNHTEIYKYNLYSVLKLERNDFPQCDDCSVNKRLVMKFQELPSRDPVWDANANFIMRRIVESGVEKLKVQFVMTEPAGRIPAGLSDEYQGFSLPFGDYTLIKQP